MTTRVLTPEKAKKLLAVPGSMNRSINKNRIRRYARDMARGRWREDNQDPIALDEETGAVLNGQHRLLAIAIQEDSFELRIVIITMPKDGILTIDGGGVRNLAEQLQVRSHDYAREKSALLHTSALWATGRSAALRLSMTDRVEWLERNPNLVAIAKFQRTLENRPRTDLIRVPLGPPGVLWDISSFGGGGEWAEEFFMELLEHPYSDLLRRTTRLIANAKNRQTLTTISAGSLGYLLARVFVAYVSDENPQKLYARRSVLRTIPGYAEWLETRWADFDLDEEAADDAGESPGNEPDGEPS